jgi:rubrerythrin
MNPSVLTEHSHSEYREGTSLADMVREDLIAERIAIETYREIIHFFGDRDPTSRILMEEILAKEEEHADDMADLLFAVEPSTGEGSRPLYFADEVPAGNGGKQKQGSKPGTTAGVPPGGAGKPAGH